jgi:hypothetical protein
MEIFTIKTVSFFMQQMKLSAGNMPIMFALGNLDSYTGLGPDSGSLSDAAELYYTQFMNGIVDHQTFLNTFRGILFCGAGRSEPDGDRTQYFRVFPILRQHQFECSNR